MKMEGKPRNILGWVQVAVTICLCIMTIAAVPWIRAVNEDLSKLRSDMNSMPEKIRVAQLESEDVTRKELTSQLSVIVLSIQRIELDLARHTAATVLKP